MRRSFIETVRPVFTKDENTLTERVHKIVQNAVKVCCDSFIARPEYDTIIPRVHVIYQMADSQRCSTELAEVVSYQTRESGINCFE